MSSIAVAETFGSGASEFEIEFVPIGNPGNAPDKSLEKEIRDFVRKKLAAHEYPREIEFVSELPMTALLWVLTAI